MAWAIFFAAFGVLFIRHAGNEVLLQQFGVLAWKLVMVGFAVSVAHIVRSQMFPYIDLKGRLNEPGGGSIFLGICILASAIILALCSGL